MKNTIKLLMCAVVAFCFASCTPENEGDTYRFTLSANENSIIATWEAVTGALYYEIHLNENVPVEVKTTAHKFENLDYNNTYSVTLNAIGDAKAVLKSVTKSIKLVRKSTPTLQPQWNLQKAPTSKLAQKTCTGQKRVHSPAKSAQRCLLNLA